MKKRKLGDRLPFELSNLELIYDEMVECLEDGCDKNKDAVLERIRQMTEFQLWGEKNNESFFDFFCEKNVLELMLKILKASQSRDITIQIIQSLSMYLTNIKKPVNINYVLSNNSINEFITHAFNFNDDETVDYYISFLKSLSLRLEVIPLELFYNERYKDFPLMAQAVRFYNHPGSMVRTSVQNITLTLFKLDDSKLQTYFTSFPFINYFVNLSCYLRDLWIKIDEVLPNTNIHDHSRLKELLDDQFDLLMYIDDIFQLQKEKINLILANALISYAMIPALIVPFTSSKKGLISLNLSLYLINMLINSLSHGPLIEFIVAMLFTSKISPHLLEQCLSVPKEPLSYSKTWNFRTTWDKYEEHVHEKYLALLEEPDTTKNSFSTRASKDEIGSSPEKSNPDLSIVDEEHKILSRCLGITTDIGLEGVSQYSCIHLFKEFDKNFSNNGDELGHIELIANPISEAYLSFLMSKDDNMILVITNILNSILNHRLIPAKLLSICNLEFEKNDILSQLNQENNSEHRNQRNQTTLFILDCLYKLFILDPPFRIITMRIITKLILELSQHRKEKVMISPDHLKIFNIGYKNSITKAMKFLQNSITADFFVELFDVQWKNIYKKDFQKMDKKDYLFMLLPFIEEPVPGVDPAFRLPAGEYELAKREISIFLLFRKLRYSLIKSTKYMPQFIEDYNSGLRKENPSNYWEEGKFYSIDSRKLIPCSLDENNNKTPCYITEDDENFVLIKLDPNRIHWAQVLTNVKLKYTEAIINRTDSHVLTVTVRMKDKYIDKNLIFTDQNLCQAAKRTLEENRRYSKHHEITVLVKNFEYAKNDIFE